MKRMWFKRAQTLTEVALIIGVAGLVFIGMQIYVRRGVQGKVKDLTDKLIGTKQEAYQQDISGLKINTSESTASAESVQFSAEGPGGQKLVTITEDPNKNYRTYRSESNSEISP